MDLSHRNIETISGLVAGFATTIATHPLDVIKIRLQLADRTSNKPFELISNVLREINASAISAQRKNTSSSWPKAAFLIQQCYRGVVPNLVGNVAAWAIYFTAYDELKRRLATNGSTNYFAASALAGASTSVATNPIWVLKTRILSTPRGAKHAYSSVFDGIRKIIATEGIATFWSGTLPSLFLVFQGSLQFTLYDHTKNYMSLKSRDGELSSMQYLIASTMARTVSMVIMYPPQVVKARLQSFDDGRHLRTVASVIRHLVSHKGGIAGLYQGLAANLVRVLPSTAVMFLSYESTKAYLSRSCK